ncbi:SprB repeat-containing protein, partial [Flavobacteriales bacterium]|nr:SprB repeat-containing protein [Flavobacteriales bacterium]
MIKRLLILSLIINVFTSLNAQIIVSNDTSTCGNYIDILQAVGADQDSINQDDDYSGLIQIGFPFTFYGNTYTSLVVCDNGYITFDAYQANNSSSGYQITSPVPLPFLLPIANSTGPNNAIMAPWHDVLLASPFGGGSGSIFISKTGIAPNRKFIATWCATAMFSCTDSLNTFQIVLHESSNKIETFIDIKRSCSWNNGAAVHGLVDATSTNFDIVIDPVLSQPRNFPLLWTASQEGWEFLPSGTASYTINQIPFSAIYAGVATWTDVNGNVLGVGGTLPVSLSASSVIYASISGVCSGNSLVDSIVINIQSCFDIVLSGIEASCLGNDAYIMCAPDTLLSSWNVELQGLNGIAVQVIPNITDSSYTFSNILAGIYIVKITDTLGNSAQDTIIVNQSQNNFTINSNVQAVSCYNGNDGQIGIWPVGGLAPYTFLMNGNPILNSFPLDSLVENLSGGSYIISVIDDDNCMIMDTVV